MSLDVRLVHAHRHEHHRRDGFGAAQRLTACGAANPYHPGRFSRGSKEVAIEEHNGAFWLRAVGTDHSQWIGPRLNSFITRRWLCVIRGFFSSFLFFAPQ